MIFWWGIVSIDYKSVRLQPPCSNFLNGLFSALKFLFDRILESLGQLIALQRLITESPELCVQLTEPERVIGINSIVTWHKWGMSWPYHERGLLNGRQYSCGEYVSSQARHQEIENFVRCEIIENWTCDIQDVTGLSASKSDLLSFFLA